MKILILTNLFPTPWDPLRGAFNRQQFERLGRRHDIDVLVPVDFRERMTQARGHAEVRHLHVNYFTFVYLPRIGRALHALCWLVCLLWQCGRQLRNRRYDCLLVSWAYPDGAAASWLARRLGIPYVLKVHGSDLNVQAESGLRRLQIQAALRQASAVVSVSRALAEKAINLGAAADAVHVLYNGVDGALFQPGVRSEARARLDLPANLPLLLYVGNLKASKGCMDLLEAFPALVAAYPRARLVYVGTGPCDIQLRERARVLGCADRVELRGPVAHDALGDWFRAADLLCLPSHNEGVPNVVLEAMACGTPVVATRVGGIPEVVPEYAGVLVPPHDRGALAAALIEASRRTWEPRRITLHASGFRWDDNVDRLDRILQSAVVHTTPAMETSV